MADAAKPWAKPMPDAQFQLMHDILAAPSPIGLEGAMTHGVLKPYFESIAPSGWAVQAFRGHAGVVLDTHPGRDDLFTVMVIGHADKIRMQVRSIGEDGKVWINSDSFCPPHSLVTRSAFLAKTRTPQVPIAA
jgi:Cellulase M and related proteins